MRSAHLLSVGLVASLFVATPVVSAQQAGGLDDPTIVAIFDGANTVDIETGQLAVERGSTDAIRNFGKMLVTDHTNVRKMGRDLATKLGVTPTPPADHGEAAAHRALMRKLGGLSGTAFDRAFLEHEIAFHAATIDAITTTLLPAIKNAEVKALVEKVSPAFVGHLKMAESMLKAM